MRGKRILGIGNAKNGRITPADAGKTALRQSRTVLLRDHPRGCGENWHIGYIIRRFQGSPPRMRGKRTQALPLPCVTGITPADAGKTSNRTLQ